MANTRKRSTRTRPTRCDSSGRTSVFLVKARNYVLEETSAPWATHVAVPSKQYAAHLYRRSWQKKKSSIQPRWSRFSGKLWPRPSGERVFGRWFTKGRCVLAALKQPGGWIIQRKQFGALWAAPPETLSTMLDGLPVVFSTLTLAALVSESQLVVLANLKWAPDTSELNGTLTPALHNGLLQSRSHH
jgi:hypothetical protein